VHRLDILGATARQSQAATGARDGEFDVDVSVKLAVFDQRDRLIGIETSLTVGQRHSVALRGAPNAGAGEDATRPIDESTVERPEFAIGLLTDT